MEVVVEFFILAFITAVVLVVVVPLGLGYLLLRQVRRARRGRRVRPPGVVGGRLSRQWSRLAAEAVTAGERYHAAVAGVPPGPLRASLDDATADVHAAVGEAQRLAWQADRTQRAHGQVLAALQGQQRRLRAPHGLTPEVQAPLETAVRAQHDSVQRLALALRRDHWQLQLVVARLNELVAHAYELSALAAPPAPTGVATVADRVAALRAATLELQDPAQA